MARGGGPEAGGWGVTDAREVPGRPLRESSDGVPLKAQFKARPRLEDTETRRRSERRWDGPYPSDLTPKVVEGLREAPLRRGDLKRPMFDHRPDPSADVGLSLGAEIRRRRESVAHERVEFLEWAGWVPEPKAGHLDFARFPFQVEMYTAGARCPEAVVKKATQVGVSAWLLRWAMYWADMRAATSLYVFPKLKQMYDFCMAGDEQVLMADGTLREIRDVREGDRVLSSDGACVVEDTVTAAWCSGMRPLVSVELAGGRVIRCTREHRIFTRRGWLRAGGLAAGDEVQVARTLPETRGGLDVDDAFLLALWLAEGSKTRAGFTFTNATPEVRARAREIAQSRGWDAYEGAKHVMALTAKWSKSEDTPAALLRRFGVRGMRTDTIRVPEAVMKASRAAQEEFWRTYVACDGCVGAREVTVASASERMVRDLQVLAARLGMPGTVRSLQPRYPGAKRAWTFAAAEAGAREVARRIGVYGKLEPSGVAEAEPGGLGWARVKSIVDSGVEETYDLETERHAFFVEGGLVHNSDARIRASILKSEYLSGRIPSQSVQNKGLKQVGGGFVYFRGSDSEDDLDSIDADCLCLDEYDRLTPENVPVAERRISGSRLGLIRRVGVPTVPGFGISRLYEETDRRRWLVKCRRGHEQALSWEENACLERRLRVCSTCGRELRPEDVAAGRWAAERTESGLPVGWHLGKLAVPEVAMARLVAASEGRLPEQRQAFWNRDMAEAYAPAEGRLSADAINAAVGAGRDAGVQLEEGYAGGGVVTAGIDVASARALNVRVSLLLRDGRKRVLWLGEVSDFDELDRLMERYSVSMAAIDHLPEGRLARAFAERHPGRAYLVRYSAGTMNRVMSVDDTARTVTVKRTEAIDAAFEMIRAQRNLLCEGLPKGWREAMQAPIRIAESDASGRKRVRYESTGRDDWAHAEVYDLVAGELWRYRTAVEAEVTESFSRLEDMLPDFERTALREPSDTYRGGPEDGWREWAEFT